MENTNNMEFLFGRVIYILTPREEKHAKELEARGFKEAMPSLDVPYNIRELLTSNNVKYDPTTNFREVIIEDEPIDIFKWIGNEITNLEKEIREYRNTIELSDLISKQLKYFLKLDNDIIFAIKKLGFDISKENPFIYFAKNEDIYYWEHDLSHGLFAMLINAKNNPLEFEKLGINLTYLSKISQNIFQTSIITKEIRKKIIKYDWEEDPDNNLFIRTNKKPLYKRTVSFYERESYVKDNFPYFTTNVLQKQLKKTNPPSSWDLYQDLNYFRNTLSDLISKPNNTKIRTAQLIELSLKNKITANPLMETAKIIGKTEYEYNGKIWEIEISQDEYDITLKSTTHPWGDPSQTSVPSCERIGGQYGRLDNSKQCGFASDIKNNNAIAILRIKGDPFWRARCMLRWGYETNPNFYFQYIDEDDEDYEGSTDEDDSLAIVLEKWYVWKPSVSKEEILKADEILRGIISDYSEWTHMKTPYGFSGYSDSAENNAPEGDKAKYYKKSETAVAMHPRLIRFSLPFMFNEESEFEQIESEIKDLSMNIKNNSKIEKIIKKSGLNKTLKLQLANILLKNTKKIKIKKIGLI